MEKNITSIKCTHVRDGKWREGKNFREKGLKIYMFVSIQIKCVNKIAIHAFEQTKEEQKPTILKS